MAAGDYRSAPGHDHFRISANGETRIRAHGEDRYRPDAISSAIVNCSSVVPD